MFSSSPDITGILTVFTQKLRLKVRSSACSCINVHGLEALKYIIAIKYTIEIKNKNASLTPCPKTTLQGTCFF